MAKTIKKSRKSGGGPMSKVEYMKVFVKRMLETTPVIRLYHWKTESRATHKATDHLLGTLTEIIDKYVETLIGKTNIKLKTSDYNTLTVKTPENNQGLEKYIHELIDFLLEIHKKLDLEKDVDLTNLRDEMIGDLNRFLYLLRLK
jgi:hypothetical protein